MKREKSDQKQFKIINNNLRISNKLNESKNTYLSDYEII